MTVRLTIDRERWWNHVTDVAAAVDGLVPVVKGNGYGFGRAGLASVAIKLNPMIAVGTVHELEGLPADARPVVLTPTLAPPKSTEPILTVGSRAHIEALAGWKGQVIVKLVSGMHRYGRGIELLEMAQHAGLATAGVSIHPPLAGTDDEHRSEIVKHLSGIDPSHDVWVSHLSPSTYESLPVTHRYKMRIGTYLWHGDREALKLQANVLDTRPVMADERAGYRQNPVPGTGTLLMVGAGTANGVAPLPDGRSPFHFDRRRLEMLEPPHMHTSMVWIQDGTTAPLTGDWLDLQRPLTTTSVDELLWT